MPAFVGQPLDIHWKARDLWQISDGIASLNHIGRLAEHSDPRMCIAATHSAQGSQLE